MSEEKKCPFEIGQCVKHRSSEEPAVVVSISNGCTTHSQAEHMAWVFQRGKAKAAFLKECNQVYRGMVMISTGFNVPDIEVEDFRLVED